MNTHYANAINQKENGTRLGGNIIREGGLVAFPTETVYGLGANGLDGEAVRKIFEAKGRPADNPLILHVARRSDVKPLWKRIPDIANRLMDAFWPGALTLIYYKSDLVPGEVSAGLNTVAVRMPENKTALALIREANVPIAAPSANISGRPSPTKAEHVRDDFDGIIDMIIDGGSCKVGLESTVLSLAGEPTILRPGAITREMIEGVIGGIIIAKSVLEPMEKDEKPSSPGMKYRHYAPDAEVIVVAGNLRAMASIINREYEIRESMDEKCAIFASEQTKGFYRGKHCVIIGDRNEPATLCANLFAQLRAHSGGVDVIFCEAVEEKHIGLAYMNRLLRAAGFNVIDR